MLRRLLRPDLVLKHGESLGEGQFSTKTEIKLNREVNK